MPTHAADPGRQLGGKGGGAALLEKSGLNLSQSSEQFNAKTDDTGGGGNNGGKVNNGGSGGDGDEGDDDDYFDDGDDEARGRPARPPGISLLEGSRPPARADRPPLQPLRRRRPRARV